MYEWQAMYIMEIAVSLDIKCSIQEYKDRYFSCDLMGKVYKNYDKAWKDLPYHTYPCYGLLHAKFKPICGSPRPHKILNCRCANCSPATLLHLCAKRMGLSINYPDSLKLADNIKHKRI